VTEKESLQLIVAYDKNRNEYSLVAHNQTPEEAESYLDQWSRHLREGHSFVVLDQTKWHATERAQSCRACRDTVARSADLEPQAKFVRRKE
jgi:predicted kinase